MLVSVVLISLTFLIYLSYSVFLTASFFTALLTLHEYTGTGTILSTSNLSTLFFTQFKPLGGFSNLSISNLWASDFKPAKLTALDQK